MDDGADGVGADGVGADGVGADGVGADGVGADGVGAPYVAVIFSSVRTDDDDEGYAAMADLMDELARRQPGFVDIESARGADRFGLTVSYWTSEADARAWKQVAEHLGAQQLGRERWYRSYRTRVATVTREYGWSSEG